MSKEKLARFISIIFGPIFLWPLIIFFVVKKSNLSNIQQQRVWEVFFVLDFLIPLILFIIALKTKVIGDFDMTKKEDRRLPMLVFSFLTIICLGLVRFFGNSQVLNYCLLLFFIFIINGLITIFWKISSHMAVNTVAIIFINYFFHWQYWYLIVMIPITFWARLCLKRHTIAQLFGGLLVNGILLSYFLYGQSYWGLVYPF